MRYHVGALLAVLLTHCKPLFAVDDPCAYPDPIGQPFSFRLHHSYLGEYGFFGVFELENRSSQAIVIPGHKGKNTFTSGRPDVTIQFKDLTSNWESLLSLPGSFLPRPDRMTIASGGKGSLSIFLMPPEVANQSASEFRVLIRLFDPATCITSAPFIPRPRRDPVTGFESSPESTAR